MDDNPLTSESSYPIRCPDTSPRLCLSKTCLYRCFKDSLDHLHPHLFAKCGFCCEKGHFYPVFFSVLLFVLFLYFVHDSSFVLLEKKKNEEDVGTKSKKTQKDQLKAATYE